MFTVLKKNKKTKHCCLASTGPEFKPQHHYPLPLYILNPEIVSK
jgi:hypothetical protein